jgi:uncharacterized protein (DUF111 family)
VIRSKSFVVTYLLYFAVVLYPLKNSTGEESCQLWNSNTLTHLEANLDDATPELMAHAIDLLLDNGAIDAWVVPIVMKKGRPAHSVSCLCDGETATENNLLAVLFRHTTTLGIRIHRNISRASLQRRFFRVQLPYRDNSRGGEVDVKVSSFNNEEVVSVKAEFDQCKIIAKESNVPLKIVANTAERLTWQSL